MIWGRAMTAPAAEYRKALYTRAVIEAAEDAGLRLSGLTVLYYLCRWSKADGPHVDQSKGQIACACGLTEQTVKRTLSKMREMGVIRPIARQQGGKLRGRGGMGASVVYRLEVVDRGGKNPPLQEAQTPAIGGEKITFKGGKKSSFRGGKNPPPNRDQYKSRETGLQTALAGQGGERQADKAGSAMTVQEQEEVAQFSQDCRRHGYTEARHLAQLRAAQNGKGELP